MSTEKLLMSNLFSERLKSLRGVRTPAEFARFLGIPAPMYHRYEKGQIPKGNNLRVIAEKTGRPVDWLLTGKESVSVTLCYGIRERLFEAKGATGLDALGMAQKMGVDPKEVERLMTKGGDATMALIKAFEAHLQPAIDLRRSQPETLENLRTENAELKNQLARANAVIDKLTGRK